MDDSVMLVSEGETAFAHDHQAYNIDNVKWCEVDTPFGRLAPVMEGVYGGRRFLYLSHGGRCRSLPLAPGVAAALWLARERRVSRILSVTLVGGINRLLSPGDAVVCNDYIDHTFARHRGLLVSLDERLSYHCLSGRPFCPDLSRLLVASAREVLPTVNVFGRGVYVNTEGPRYETAAEIRALAGMGADVVGHTVVPAAVMAREIRACFAVGCIVGNMAEGLADHNEEFWSVGEVADIAARWLLGAMGDLQSVRTCDCGDDRWWVGQPEVREP